jgi:7-cyano-7-deazaguanine reductase
MLLHRLASAVSLRRVSSSSLSSSATLNLTQLGKKVVARDDPDKQPLEIVPNPHPDVVYVTRLTCPEFTSLCPVTSQPDFAHLVIDYIPDRYLVESKSLKLFLQSFRNHGAFHEDCTVYISKRLVSSLQPHWLRISGFWYPRGGIPIDVFYQTGTPPQHAYVPDPGIPPYRAR